MATKKEMLKEMNGCLAQVRACVKLAQKMEKRAREGFVLKSSYYEPTRKRVGHYVKEAADYRKLAASNWKNYMYWYKRLYPNR